MSHINSAKYLGRAVVYHQKEGENIIHGMNLLRLVPISIMPNFAEYYFKSFHFKKQIAQITKKAVNQASFTTTDLKNVTIPVPSLPTQQRIVSELDLLQSIIDKQQAQLKELDTLAQAVFYDMFGDPVENEKGWEVKRLGDVCEVTSSKRVYQSEWRTFGIPFYRISDFTQLVNNVAFDAELFISPEKYDELKGNGQVPNAGDILVTSRGTLGNCYIVKNSDCFYFQDGMITWLKAIDDSLLSLFIVFLFRNNSFRSQIEKCQSGTTVAYLSISMLKKFKLPVPPLALQQTFAEKIEAIEKQKATIAQSIAETQKLFDYTMDKYFGQTPRGDQNIHPRRNGCMEKRCIFKNELMNLEILRGFSNDTP